MDQKKYTLTCHTYPDHLRGMMWEMMTTEDFADVTLVCDDKKTVRAHKNILSACSKVFKDILQLPTQSNHPVIFLRGIQYSEVEAILQYMYLGEAKFYEERINEFLRAVKDLEIKGLSKAADASDQQPDEATDDDPFANSIKNGYNTDPAVLKLLESLTSKIKALKSRSVISDLKEDLPLNNPRTNQPYRRYCWTHGCGNHWSNRCRNPKPGHQNDATFKNRMGGSNKGCLPVKKD